MRSEPKPWKKSRTMRVRPAAKRGWSQSYLFIVQYVISQHRFDKWLSFIPLFTVISDCVLHCSQRSQRVEGIATRVRMCVTARESVTPHRKSSPKRMYACQGKPPVCVWNTKKLPRTPNISRKSTTFIFKERFHFLILLRNEIGDASITIIRVNPFNWRHHLAPYWCWIFFFYPILYTAKPQTSHTLNTLWPSIRFFVCCCFLLELNKESERGCLPFL